MGLSWTYLKRNLYPNILYLYIQKQALPIFFDHKLQKRTVPVWETVTHLKEKNIRAEFIYPAQLKVLTEDSERWSHGATGGQASGLVGWEGADGEQRWGKKSRWSYRQWMSKLSFVEMSDTDWSWVSDFYFTVWSSKYSILGWWHQALLQLMKLFDLVQGPNIFQMAIWFSTEPSNRKSFLCTLI